MFKFNHKNANPACSKRLINIQSPLIDTKVFRPFEAMILTCPSCSATYTVPAEALGDKGRDVRCKKCAHTWFQKSEKDSLNELIEKIQSTDIPEDDISFGDGGAYAKALKKEQRKSLSLRFSELLKSIKGKFAPLYEKLRVKFLVKFAPALPYLEKLKLDPKSFAGAMVAVAMMSVVLYGVVASRFMLVEAMPSLRSVYVSAGFPLVSYDPLIKPEEALVIERAQLIKGEIGGKDGRVVANIINLTSSEVFLPPLYVRMIDAHGQVLKEVSQKLAQQSLLKESSVELSMPVPADIMMSIATVEISFSKDKPDEVKTAEASKSESEAGESHH